MYWSELYQHTGEKYIGSISGVIVSWLSSAVHTSRGNTKCVCRLFSWAILSYQAYLENCTYFHNDCLWARISRHILDMSISVRPHLDDVSQLVNDSVSNQLLMSCSLTVRSRLEVTAAGNEETWGEVVVSFGGAVVLTSDDPLSALSETSSEERRCHLRRRGDTWASARCLRAGVKLSWPSVSGCGGQRTFSVGGLVIEDIYQQAAYRSCCLSRRAHLAEGAADVGSVSDSQALLFM